MAAAELGSTDISAASGLDTAAVLAVASGAPFDTGPRGARRARADGGGAAGIGAGAVAMTLQTALGVLEQERAPAYRARQLTHAVYAELAERWDEVTALPRPLRERLERDAPLRTLREEDAQRADDGTIKLQLRTHDGYPLEAVAMRHGDRRTVCLSSQSGCALACTFCATGRMGLGRNLEPEEISEQLLRLARLLRDEQDARVSNVVMMGMGEPFHNYDNVLAAIRTDQRAGSVRPGRSSDRDLHGGLDPRHRPAGRGAAADQARALAARRRRRAAPEAHARHEALPDQRADGGLQALPRAARAGASSSSTCCWPASTTRARRRGSSSRCCDEAARARSTST